MNIVILYMMILYRVAAHMPAAPAAKQSTVQPMNS
jgi:hypothetical protein